MRITRLEIFGFKSFMERFVLNFDLPLIGVVGPNGCGKSNIVDALRWVLGETHAKHLRGSVLDDIIFNGSESRRPLGMAEVSITIRPAEGWADGKLIDHEELKREQEDSALVPADIHGEPLEPELLAEGAETTEQTVESSLATLKEAVPGLFEAEEIQLTRRLYRSGESEYFINRVPCRLRDMSDFYRAIGLGPRGLSIVQQGQIGQIVTTKPIERRQLLEEAAGISGFRVRIEAAGRQLSKTKNNIDRLSDIILEVEKQVRVLGRQANRAKRRDEVKIQCREAEKNLYFSKIAQLQSGHSSVSSEKAVVEEQLRTKEDALQVVLANETSLRAEIETIDNHLSEVRREKDSLSSKIQQIVAKKNQARVARAQLEGQLQTVRERISSNDNREDSISAEIEQQEQRLAEAFAGVQSTKELADDLNASLSVVQDSEFGLADLEKELSELERAYRDQQRELNDKKIKHAALEAEVAAMTRQLENRYKESGSGSKEKINNILHSAAAEALISKIRVEEEWRLAVQVALENDESLFLVDSPVEVLTQAIEVDSKGGSSVRLASRNVEPFLVHLEQCCEFIPERTSRLIDHLHIDLDATKAIQAVLGNVFLVESAKDAQALFDGFLDSKTAEKHLVRAITRSGELITPWGASAGKQTSNILELRPLIESKQSEIENLSEEVNGLTNSISEVEQRVNQLRTEKGTLAQERARLQSQQNERQSKLAAAMADVARAEERVRLSEQRIVELKNEKQVIHDRRERYTLEASELEARMKESSGENTDLWEDATEERDLVAAEEELRRKMGEQEDKRDEVRLQLSELLQRVDELRRGKDQLNASLSDVSLRAEKTQIELEMLHEDALIKLGEELARPKAELIAEFEESIESTIESHISNLTAEVSKLRAKLERDGDVDPEVITLHEQEVIRLEEMKTQREDLGGAATTLDRTIRQLKDISRKRFVETFHSVDEKFQKLVPRLFGGGAGHLELIDPEDPLTSGVELTVRPPGKKLRSMELMSGGEKALAATAILIAMFLHRPSPICVLDEVDAPLDDANLERFLELIKEIATKTQFLIITHNKQSMHAVDKLIGITMEEKGVSRALTVSFEDAEKQLEELVANG